jgi:putative ABC transport system ATP-binding protein
MSSFESVVTLRDTRFAWHKQAHPVINIPHLDIKRGERVFLYGPSGSGKSTLLSIIAAVISPQSGSVVVDGVELTTLSGAAADRFRADHIGFIFQQFNLLPFLSVVENVQLPCQFSKLRGERVTDAGFTLTQEAGRLLQTMKLPRDLHASRSVMQLSVGQQQRVAAARALMGKPPLVIADEPTSSLDADARMAFIQLLFAELTETGASLVFVSHDTSLETLFDRSLSLSELNAHAQSVSE